MPHSPSLAQRARQPHSHVGVRFSHDVHPSLPAPNTMPGSIAHAAAQTASAGHALSKDLYRFVPFARGPAGNIDVPDDVQSVARSLDDLAHQFQLPNTTSLFSQNAIQDANDLVARSDAVFTEIRHFLDSRRQRGPNGEVNATPVDDSAWPMSEQSTELLRRRLGSLKDSLALILHILHFAHVQARGALAERDYEEERDKVRELHSRQQKSLEALKAIESSLGSTYPPGGETFQASNIPSRVPTIDFIVNTQGPSRTPPSTRSTFRGVNPTATAADHFSEHSHVSDSEDTATDEDDEEREPGVERPLTADGLAHCTAHIQELLKGVTNLQASSEKRGRLCSRYRVQKLYKRFCRRFEASMEDRKPSVAASAAPFPGFQPPPDSRDELTSHRPHMAAPELRSNSVYSYESSHRNLASIQELRRTQSVGSQSQYIERVSAGIAPNEPQPNGRDDRAIDPHLRAISERNPSISARPMAHVHNEVMSRETSKEGSQSGADREMESMSGRSAPVHYTKTGRISKAKKGLKVHACSECGKSFTRAEHLRRHQKNHGPDQVTCELCGKVFFRVDLLMRHVERHKDGPLLASGAHSMSSSQEAFDSHRPVSYPHAPPPAGLERRDSRPVERQATESSQPWHYVWDERDRRYVQEGKGVPASGDQRSSRRDSESQTRSQHGGVSFNTPGIPSSASGEHTHPNTTRPTDYESPWQNPNKRRRTEGDIHRAPYSPLHSPPSPWVKEHRKLPPLPSPLQTSYTHSSYSGTNERGKGLRSISPSSRTWTNVNSPQTAKPADAIRLQITPHASQHYEDRKTYGNTQTSTANDAAERGWGPTPSRSGPSQSHGPETALHRTSSFSKSQSTSPVTSSTPRIYPNPLRPHEPRQGAHHSHAEKPAVDAMEPESLASRHDSGVTEYAEHAQSKHINSTDHRAMGPGGYSTQDKNLYEHQRPHESEAEMASQKRKLDEQHADGRHSQQHPPTYTRHFTAPPKADDNNLRDGAQVAPSSFAGKHERPGVPLNPPERRTANNNEGKKDIVDTLLEHWTVPHANAGVTS